MELAKKQKIFANEYLVDLNATRAYKTAYPNIKKDETARAAGSRLLANVNVAAYVQGRMDARAKRTEVTQDWVLEELRKIAAVNGSDFAKIILDGDYPTVKMVATDELPEEKKSAIAAIKEGKFGITVESYDRIKALELLGRHLGMFKDKTELSGDIGLNVTVDYGEGEEDETD